MTESVNSQITKKEIETIVFATGGAILLAAIYAFALSGTVTVLTDLPTGTINGARFAKIVVPSTVATALAAGLTASSLTYCALEEQRGDQIKAARPKEAGRKTREALQEATNQWVFALHLEEFSVGAARSYLKNKQKYSDRLINQVIREYTGSIQRRLKAEDSKRAYSRFGSSGEIRYALAYALADMGTPLVMGATPLSKELLKATVLREKEPLKTITSEQANRLLLSRGDPLQFQFKPDTEVRFTTVCAAQQLANMDLAQTERFHLDLEQFCHLYYQDGTLSREQLEAVRDATQMRNQLK